MVNIEASATEYRHISDGSSCIIGFQTCMEQVEINVDGSFLTARDATLHSREGRNQWRANVPFTLLFSLFCSQAYAP
jgi:hypothetical protein